jgi:hypothetical protein
MTDKFSQEHSLFPEWHQTMTQPYLTIVLMPVKFTATVAFKSLHVETCDTHVNIQVLEEALSVSVQQQDYSVTFCQQLSFHNNLSIYLSSP